MPGIVASDEFNRTIAHASLPLVWQWNHNPNNKLWSVRARKGYLRLQTERTDTSLLFARNTLTQRTFGPTCEGQTSIDVSRMKEGDLAGLALLQKNYGLVGIEMKNGRKNIVMINATTGKPEIAQSLPLDQSTVFLKAFCDFTDKKDVADFFYSLDGKIWQSIGTQLKMAYTIPHFMGYRFGLFYYSTKDPGGMVDFDFFRIK